MKSNVKRRVGHDIHQKEKKTGHNARDAICSSNVKKKRVGNFLHQSKNLFVLTLSHRVFGGGKKLVENFDNYNILLKSCVSLLSLFANFFQFALKKIRDFLFLCLSLGTQTTRTSGISLD